MANAEAATDRAARSDAVGTVPVVCEFDFTDGSMSGRTGVKVSRLRDLAGLFADPDAFRRRADAEGDEVAYEVHEFRPARQATQDLIFGASTLQPGRVGSEFFLTKGHLHLRADRPEVYFCQSGRGILHLEDLEGETRPVEMAPGSIVYVPPYWIHRSVNTGNEPLITVFCYPADAGQDYGIIERSGGMRTLIVDDGKGGWKEAENPRYRPRTPQEQEGYRRSS